MGTQEVLAEDLKIGQKVVSGFSNTGRIVTELTVTPSGMISIKGIGWGLLRRPDEPVRVILK